MELASFSTSFKATAWDDVTKGVAEIATLYPTMKVYSMNAYYGRDYDYKIEKSIGPVWNVSVSLRSEKDIAEENAYDDAMDKTVAVATEAVSK